MKPVCNNGEWSDKSEGRVLGASLRENKEGQVVTNISTNMYLAIKRVWEANARK
jgi:hypothetical protein